MIYKGESIFGLVPFKCDNKTASKAIVCMREQHSLNSFVRNFFKKPFGEEKKSNLLSK